MEQVDELQCRCYFDILRTASTHRSRQRDLSDEMGRCKQKRVSAKKNSDHDSVLAKYMCQLVGFGNFETTEGLRTDSPAGDVGSHKIACSWCAQAHVSTHSCDFTNGYLQGQEIDRILLYLLHLKVSQKKELREEKFWSRVFPSTVEKMQDEDCGFVWKTHENR